MNKKSLVAIVVMLMCIFAITGCANSTQDKVSSISDAQLLYDARNQYIGNSSADLKLLNLLKINELGKYTIELETSKEPYMLRIIFADTNKDFDEETFNNAMRNNSILLLTLIDNAKKIEWKYSKEGVMTEKSMTTDDANKLVGENVKSYGKSIEDLEKLIKLLNSKK